MAQGEGCHPLAERMIARPPKGRRLQRGRFNLKPPAGRLLREHKAAVESWITASAFDRPTSLLLDKIIARLDRESSS